ncbi:MAG TPA: YggS family pyridoxal phosphate-dependent enzyme [Kofleriaceae bacterium]
MTTIADNWHAIRARVDAAASRAGRAPSEVTIVAVSKFHPISAIREAIAAGARDFGENYAQELAAKQNELAATWHFIGRLQRNKAKLVAGKVALVHAVDSVELAVELGKRAGDQPQAMLLAVNLANEATKGGVTAETAPALAKVIAAAPNVTLAGLMTMPPPEVEPRPLFEQLRGLRDRIADELGNALPVLSMGMSGDFETAIACGATHVRIGTAIFGERPPA